MPESNAPEERSGGQHSQFAWMLEQLTDVFLGAGGKSPGQAAMIDGIFASAAGKLEAPALAALCAQLGHRLAELPLLSLEIARLRAPSQASEWAAAAAVIALPVQPALAGAEAGEALSTAATRNSPDCAFHGLTEPSAQIHLARAADAATLGRIARSPGLTEAMTTILVSRGSRSVLHAVTANPTAQFAKSCFTTLAELAPSDRALRENLALRADLPEAILGKLMPFLPEALKARARWPVSRPWQLMTGWRFCARLNRPQPRAGQAAPMRRSAIARSGRTCLAPSTRWPIILKSRAPRRWP